MSEKEQIQHWMRVIGARIRAARTLRKKSQEGLAELAGLSKRWIGQIESGESTSIENLLSIVQALRLEPQVLLVELERSHLDAEISPEETYALVLRFLKNPDPQ